MMREAKLGDVVTSMKNGLYKPASEYGDDGVPCLRMYNIEAGSIVWRDIKRMHVSARELEEYGLHDGDLLVNRVNSRELVGKTACIPPSMGPSVFESKNIRVRLDPERAFPKFINYQLFARGRRFFASNAQQVVGMASISQGQLADFPIVLTDLDQQKRIVAEIEKQFSRLDEAVANLKRVKANLKRYKAAVLKSAVEGRLVETEAELACREGRSYETGQQFLQRILETRRSEWKGKGKYKEPAAPDTTDLPELPEGWAWATIGQATECLDSMRVPVNKKERLKRAGDVPYYGANGRVGSIDDYIFNEPLVLVVEDETFTGREIPFSYKITGKSWVNNHAHVLRPTGLVTWDYLNYALSYYPFTALTTGTTGRKKLTQLALVTAPFGIPPLPEQQRIVAEVERRLSLVQEVESQVVSNLKRADRLRQSVLGTAFSGGLYSSAHTNLKVAV